MKNRRYSNDDISALCTELVYLLHAGISSADAINLLAEDENREEYKAELQKMAKQADEGSLLSELFINSEKFPPYVGKMTAVGESTGRMEEALSAIANTCGRRAEIERNLKSTLLYPSALLLIMLAVIAVLLIYVMPVFSDVYAQLGGTMTGVAGGLLAFGEALENALPVLIALFVLMVIILACFSLSPAFRASIMSFRRKKHGDRGVAAKTAQASFAQAMSLAMNSGMGIAEAVEGAAELLEDNENYRRRASECAELLRSGAETAEALKKSGLLPSTQCRMLEAGIRGGAGEQAMESIARRLTEESEEELQKVIGRVEPTMVLITSIMVGIILLSVMLPLINIMSVIG